MSKLIALTGRTFGRWTVLGRSTHKPRRAFYTYWDCRCSCGRLGAVERRSLIKGRSKSCGCYHAELKRARVVEFRKSGEYARVSLAIGLKHGEIAAMIFIADHIDAAMFFDLRTEEGTKGLARYNSAIAKLRAKHRRIEKMKKEQVKRENKNGGKVRAFKHEGNVEVPDGVE